MISIYLIYKMKINYNVNLSRQIFPLLSKYFCKSIDTIHSDMKKSINIMYYDCDEEILKEYFYNDISKKPSVKKIIITILSKI